MPRIILFNADDWGLSQQIHDDITDLHQAKAIDAAGIMMGQPFTDLAIDYARSNPSLITGIHLFASDSLCQPLSVESWPQIWPSDFWINTTVWLPSVETLIYRELDVQLAAWKKTGLPLRFVNSHFHIHANRGVFDKIAHKVREHFPDFTGWLRLGDSKPIRSGIPTLLDPVSNLIESNMFVRDWRGRNNDTLFGLDTTFHNTAADLLQVCEGLDDGFHEFFLHPGRGKSLSERGSDTKALFELTSDFPQSARNLSDLRF